jgi:hypothetical protein
VSVYRGKGTVPSERNGEKPISVKAMCFNAEVAKDAEEI